MTDRQRQLIESYIPSPRDESLKDGEYYYINMERIPIGIIYNTKILEECGISYPFSSLTELINAEKKISQSNGWRR